MNQSDLPTVQTENGTANGHSVPDSPPQPQTPLETATAWIKAHPTASVLIAAATGLVVGRVLYDALTPPAPPPTFSGQLKQSTRRWSDRARAIAEEAADTLREQAVAAITAAEEAYQEAHGSIRDNVRDTVDTVRERVPAPSNVLDEIRQAVQQGVMRGVEQKIAEWSGRIRG